MNNRIIKKQTRKYVKRVGKNVVNTIKGRDITLINSKINIVNGIPVSIDLRIALTVG